MEGPQFTSGVRTENQAVLITKDAIAAVLATGPAWAKVCPHRLAPRLREAGRAGIARHLYDSHYQPVDTDTSRVPLPLVEPIRSLDVVCRKGGSITDECGGACGRATIFARGAEPLAVGGGIACRIENGEMTGLVSGPSRFHARRCGRKFDEIKSSRYKMHNAALLVEGSAALFLTPFGRGQAG
ncbi:DUF6771 family protein [Novosphingobium sp. Rr 2-17]|uniref:DUF6771 family protein n=1 Tax=Novosphingobium sp. Rr 2-17 TaxID=555793 RepID=UPI003FD4281C